MFARFPFCRWSCLFAFCLALTPWLAAAQTKEYQVKAAFLLNFTQFVSWPQTAFANSNAPLVIGVLGDDPFGTALEQTLGDESLQAHKISIKRSRHIEDLEDCQLLFVSNSENARVGEILAKLGGRPALTVSDIAGFARHGGVINFYRADNKLRFEINPEAARQGGLQISSQLLELGKIVESAKTAK